jgi:uncharacterized protein (TIGR02922 family)
MNADFPVTVLFYDESDPMVLQRQVFHELRISRNNRVILPDEFRPGRMIIAVLEGDVKVLNKLGDRCQMAESELSGPAA